VCEVIVLARASAAETARIDEAVAAAAQPAAQPLLLRDSRLAHRRL